MSERQAPPDQRGVLVQQLGDEFTSANPHDPVERCRTAWIEIVLVDETDEPVPGERFQITLPDGTRVSGALDSEGFARLDGIDSGVCEVSFPNLDRDAWEPV